MPEFKQTLLRDMALDNDEAYLPFLGCHKEVIIRNANKAEKISKISHKYA